MLKNQKSLCLILVLLVAGCGNTKKSAQQSLSEELRLYVFDVGEILIKDVTIFNSGETGAKLLTNSAYLIRHPKGDLIWDTGFPDSLVAIVDGLDSEMATIKMSTSLEGQLSAIGLAPADVEYLALSHLHPDHVGNSNLFSNAELLLQQEEYDSLFQEENINPDVADLASNSFTRLQGDHDVFGDGSVLIKRAPGHTNGHQVLFVNLPETGPIVLSGDLFITVQQRASKGVPIFNVDAEQTLATMNDIENFILEKRATLWIQHDLEQNKSIRRSPEFFK